METKNFGNKKIKIRKLARADLEKVKKFQDFINSLVEENVMIQMNKKMTLKEEIIWLKEKLNQIKKGKEVTLIAEHKDRIVGNAHIKLGWGRESHVGNFGISIRKGYRKIGLGTYLTKEIIKLAKKELKPQPKIIRLSVLPINKPAINLYKKYGFKKVATIPKQMQFQRKLVDEIIMLLEL